MVWGDHIDKNNFSPDKDRLLREFYGKSLYQTDYKPAALCASDVTVDAGEMSWNIKIGCSKPFENIVVPEKTGIICDQGWENLSDIRHPSVPNTDVKIAHSNTIQSCQWKESLCTEEKVKVQPVNKKSTVVAVKGNEQEEDIKTVSRSSSLKKDSKEKFTQGKPELTLVDGKEKVADKDEDEGQKTVGKRSSSKADSREQIPQEKLALTWDKGKFMDFIMFMRGLILVVFANYKKLKSKAFTWMILTWVFSSIMSLTKKTKNKCHWMVYLFLVCLYFGNITAMVMKEKELIFVSLEDTNSIKIVATPEENTVGIPKWTTTIDGEIKIATFNGIVKPEFRGKIHIENGTTIHIANLSNEEWRSYWTYQKGFETPIETNKLKEYVDPVCSDNLTVVDSSYTSITVMWDSGIDRGHDMVTILQYCVDGSSDWMSAYNTTEHFNQKVNFSIPDLKHGTSYDIRLLTLEGNGSSSICKSHFITEKTKPAKQAAPQKKSPDIKLTVVVAVVGSCSFILFLGILGFFGYQRLHKKDDKKKTVQKKDNSELKDSLMQNETITKV